MTWIQIGPIIAPILGLLGVVIASKISSKSAKDGVIMEGYDELVTHYRVENEALRGRCDRADAEIRRLEKEIKKLEVQMLKLTHDLNGTETD